MREALGRCLATFVAVAILAGAQCWVACATHPCSTSGPASQSSAPPCHRQSPDKGPAPNGQTCTHHVMTATVLPAAVDVVPMPGPAVVNAVTSLEAADVARGVTVLVDESGPPGVAFSQTTTLRI